jgi:hypothetical protein
METQRCREKFLNNKWLNIADKIAKNKIISGSKIRELENMGKFLYKTECQWENEMMIITQSFEKEEEAL